MIIFFFFFSFAFQMMGAYDSGRYYAPLKQGNARRSHLLEYSVSASLMMIIMCLQVGVVDTHTLANVFSNTWACMIFGLLSDVLFEFAMDECLEWIVFGYRIFKIKYTWLAHFAGWFTLIIAAAAMMSNIGTFYECLDGIKLPDKVFAAIVIETCLFFCFGTVQFYTLWVKGMKRVRPRTLDGMPNYKELKSNCENLSDKIDTLSAIVNENIRNVPRDVVSQKTSTTYINNQPILKALDAHLSDLRDISLFKAELEAIEKKRGLRFDDDRSLYMKSQQTRMLIAYRAEFAYITLSLLAKTILGGILYISAII